MGRRPLVSGVKEVPEFWRFLINYDDAWRRLDLKKTQKRLRYSEISNSFSSNMKETSKLEDLEVGYPKDILKMKEMKPYLGGYSILPLSKALLHDLGGSVLSVKMIRKLLLKVPVKKSQVRRLVVE